MDKEEDYVPGNLFKKNKYLGGWIGSMIACENNYDIHTHFYYSYEIEDIIRLHLSNKNYYQNHQNLQKFTPMMPNGCNSAIEWYEELERQY